MSNELQEYVNANYWVSAFEFIVLALFGGGLVVKYIVERISGTFKRGKKK